MPAGYGFEDKTHDDERATKFSAPLREKADDHALAITLLQEYCLPRVSAPGSQFLVIELELLLDLGELFLRYDVVRIVGGLAQPPDDGPGLVVAALGHQPPRRERQGRGAQQQDQRGHDLEGQGKAPAEAAVRGEVDAVADPCRKHVAEDQEDGMVAHQPAARQGARNFRQVHGCHGHHDADAQPHNETARLEHGKRGGSALERAP